MVSGKGTRVMNLPYTFEPLFDYLEKLDMTLDDLVIQKILSKSTVEKIANGQNVMTSTLAKLCIELGCEFPDVIAINYAYDPNEKQESDRQDYMPWSNEEEERLIDAYKEGVDMDTIVREFKRTRGAISSRLNRLEVAGRINRRKVRK